MTELPDVSTVAQEVWATVLADYDDMVTVYVYTDLSWWAWLTDDDAAMPAKIGAKIRDGYGDDYELRHWIGRDLTHTKARILSDSEAGESVMWTIYDHLSTPPSQRPEEWAESDKQQFALQVLARYARDHDLIIRPNRIYIGTHY